jgi:hypothetical protein
MKVVNRSTHILRCSDRVNLDPQDVNFHTGISVREVAFLTSESNDGLRCRSHKLQKYLAGKNPVGKRDHPARHSPRLECRGCARGCPPTRISLTEPSLYLQEHGEGAHIRRIPSETQWPFKSMEPARNDTFSYHSGDEQNNLARKLLLNKRAEEDEVFPTADSKTRTSVSFTPRSTGEVVESGQANTARSLLKFVSVDEGTDPCGGDTPCWLLWMLLALCLTLLVMFFVSCWWLTRIDFDW